MARFIDWPLVETDMKAWRDWSKADTKGNRRLARRRRALAKKLARRSIKRKS